jgi:hypothetical protein
MASEIANTIHENRMLWEPWIESAKDFQDLKESLRERGYTDLPFRSPVMHRHSRPSVVSEPDPIVTPDMSKLPKQRVMMKKPT